MHKLPIEPISAHDQMQGRFKSSVWNYSAVNCRCPSRETPLGPGVKKDGCFHRLIPIILKAGFTVTFLQLVW